jgi:hypothetical protein
VRPAAIPIAPPPSFVLHPRRPFVPPNPVVPIVPIIIWAPGFGPFGSPFFNAWPGWGLNYGLWTGCGLNWGWDFGCEAPPPYAYPSAQIFSPYSLAPGNGQTQAETQNWPVYFTGQEASQYVHLYLKDGTIFFVTDYWLVNGALHFKSVEEGGTKVVERTIDFDRLDLQKTIDVNTARGFRFVLRNEPLEQYFRDHPPTDSPNGAPAEPEPAQPQ